MARVIYFAGTLPTDKEAKAAEKLTDTSKEVVLANAALFASVITKATEVYTDSADVAAAYKAAGVEVKAFAGTAAKAKAPAKKAPAKKAPAKTAAK